MADISPRGIDFFPAKSKYGKVGAWRYCADATTWLGDRPLVSGVSDMKTRSHLRFLILCMVSALVVASLHPIPAGAMSPKSARKELKQWGIVPSGEELVKAVEEDDKQVVEMLLDAGIDANSAGALEKAIHAENKPMAWMLLNRGANPNRSPFLAAEAQRGNLELASMLLKFGADPNREQPLVSAAREGRLEIARILIDNGADKNHGHPLLGAVGNGHTAIVRLLLERGANPNQGRPLVIAAEKGRVEIVNLLLKYGAHPVSMTDKYRGGGALGAARNNGHDEVAGILLKAEAEE